MEEAVQLRGMTPLLQVFDMTASLQFYRDILHFSVLQSSGDGDDVDWVLLQQGDLTLMLNTAYEKEYRPLSPDTQRRQAHADTILYFGCADTDGLYRYLTERGLQPEPPAVTGYGWTALNLFDPDGYHLCFHWPVGDDKQR